MRSAAAWLCLLTAVTAPAAALAYVGPGAGLSLLGALWALLCAIGAAIAFVVGWPVRRLLRRRRAAREQRAGSTSGRGQHSDTGGDPG